MQDRFGLNGNKNIKQPDKGLGYSFESTYTDDSARGQNGKGHFTAIFTVEQLSYKASDLTVSEMKEILQVIAKGKPFSAHYFSPYYGKWRDDMFYVGKGNLNIGKLKEGSEIFESLSFNMTGVNPI